MKSLRFAVSAAVLTVGGLTLGACFDGAREEPNADMTAAVAAPLSTPEAAPAYVLPAAEPGTGPPNPYSAARIERGRYLVEFGGCNDCHTPWAFDPELSMPMPDLGRRLSGHPAGGPDPVGSIGTGDMALIGPTFTSFRLPFGTVYSTNLTPDIDTGTGTWTEEMFVDIFRTGRHLGGSGRPVLPPMPFLNLSHLTEEDLVSIFAYLRSLPPIRNSVPNPDVPEPVMWAIRDGVDKVLGIEAPAGDVASN